MLRQIKMVTYSVANLRSNVEAWQEYLEYKLIHEGAVGTKLATVWNTPAAAGKPMAILQPASEETVWLRFIETGHNLPFQYPLYQGWNATEILVQDPDELATRFRNSPFQLIGGPHDLYPRKKSPRAIQVIGPSGELIYFSRLLPGGSKYGLKGAKSFVDRTFNVISGGTDLAAMSTFYQERLGLRTYDPITFSIPMLADVCGVAPSTPFNLQIAKIAGRRFIIELDEYPQSVSQRPIEPGMLPPGMSMVSFAVESLEAFQLPWNSPPEAINCFGYAQQRTAVTQGAAGEWVELIESADMIKL